MEISVFFKQNYNHMVTKCPKFEIKNEVFKWRKTRFQDNRSHLIPKCTILHSLYKMVKRTKKKKRIKFYISNWIIYIYIYRERERERERAVKNLELMMNKKEKGKFRHPPLRFIKMTLSPNICINYTPPLRFI